MIEKGDKVRFIDEALEGTVTALVGQNKAEVLTSDGFTMIASVAKLVKARTGEDKQSMTEQNVFTPPVKEAEAPVKPKKIKGRIFSFNETDLKDEIIYAAFELIEPESPLTSAVQLHLVNNTGFSIAFSLSRKFEMRDEGIAIDKLEARTVKSFLTYTQEELKLFESFRIQAIIHPAGKTSFRPPVQKQFRFNADDLLESADFNVGNTNCLFIQLVDLTQAPEVDITSLIDKFSDIQKEETEDHKSKKTRQTKSSSKNIIHSNEKIVDLHIEELVKDFTAMSNGQIIALQLKHFQYEMDLALVNHLKKIIFIHGVGQGVLKSAIREELKKYDDVEVNDASLQKFGYGATEITFI